MKDRELRLAIEDRAADRECTEPLLELKGQYCRMSMLDSIAETPHAKHSKIGAHSNRSAFPFDAATFRIDQNVEDKTVMADECKMDFQKKWNDVKTITQFRNRKRPVISKWKHVVQRVYFFKPTMVKPTVEADTLGVTC